MPRSKAETLSVAMAVAISATIATAIAMAIPGLMPLAVAETLSAAAVAVAVGPFGFHGIHAVVVDGKAPVAWVHVAAGARARHGALAGEVEIQSAQGGERAEDEDEPAFDEFPEDEVGD